MSDLVVTYQCDPGKATPELALKCQKHVLGLLNVLADDIATGAVVFAPKAMHWIDDGLDEIVIRVEMPS